jgi:hypothetical protein
MRAGSRHIDSPPCSAIEIASYDPDQWDRSGIASPSKDILVERIEVGLTIIVGAEPRRSVER